MINIIQTDFNLATGAPLITSDHCNALSLMPGGNTDLISIFFPSCPQKCELNLSDGDRPHRAERFTSKGQLAGVESLPAELFDLLFPRRSLHISLHHPPNKGRTVSAGVALFSPLPFMFASICIMTGKDKERHAYSWGTSLRGHYSSSGAATNIAITHGSRKDTFTARQTGRNAIFFRQIYMNMT